MHYHVILNAEAGPDGKARADGLPEELRQGFTAAGITCNLEVLPSARMEAGLRAAVASCPDAVVVGGGDGTVRTAAGILVDTDISLGVLPLGTLNHFAKDLGIPGSIPDAVAALATASPRAIDVGEVNGLVFINNCSLGAYAEAVRRRDALRDTHGWGKGWAMLRASLTTLRRLKRLHLEIHAEPIGISASSFPPPRTVRTPLLAVANNRYSGHVLNQCLRDRLDAGELWLYTVHAQRPPSFLRLMLHALLRRLDDTAALEAEPVSAVIVACPHADVPIAADGELVQLRSPFQFRIRRGALRVLAPVPVQDVRPERPGPDRASQHASVISSSSVRAKSPPTPL